MSLKLITPVLAGAIALGAMANTGCVGHVGVAVEPEATVVEPDLAYIGPDVWVVQSYHEPVFYSGGHYYLYRGGLWYRSGVHYRGWSRAYTVPMGIRRVRRPRSYVRYRARPGVRTWRGPVRSQRRARYQRRNSRTVRADNRYRRPSRPARVRTRDHRTVPAPRVRHTRVRTSDRREDKRVYKPAKRSKRAVKRSKKRDHR